MEGKQIRGLMIGAFSSGCGKTVAACGLMEVFRRHGLKVSGFKCGPDYIDPMFHREILGVESQNLDGFFQTKRQSAKSFLAGAKDRDIGVIEGVMGYFDGIGGEGRASTYEMALRLGCPVILVAEGKGAGLSLAASILGFLEFGLTLPGHGRRKWNGIGGIILNRVSPGRYPGLKAVLEEHLPVPVLGYMPEFDWLSLESRHLGLKLPGEVKDLKAQLGRLGEELEKTIQIDEVLALAEKWEEGYPKASLGSGAGEGVSVLEGVSAWEGVPVLGGVPAPEAAILPKKGQKAAIGVAMDEAFCFYYQDNLRELCRAGARLLFFSPLKDKAVPKEARGLLFGGGYPELYARQLSENNAMRSSIRQAAAAGMPILGECGGFLYLQEWLEDGAGKVYPMAGVFSGGSRNGGKLGRFGYIALWGKEDGLYLKAGERILAHEFHYWDSECCGSMMEARKPAGNKRWLCMRQENRVLAGFPHLYYPSFPEFSRRFVRECEMG